MLLAHFCFGQKFNLVKLTLKAKFDYIVLFLEGFLVKIDHDQIMVKFDQKWSKFDQIFDQNWSKKSAQKLNK